MVVWLMLTWVGGGMDNAVVGYVEGTMVWIMLGS